MEKTIYTELNRIQKKLKVPKGQYNNFGKYAYRSCEDILEAVKNVIGECVLTIHDEIILIGDRYYVKAVAKIGYNETYVGSSAYAREPLNKKGMDESQITGTASSYARKYALNGLFAIDDTKDADCTNRHDSNESQNPADYVIKIGKKFKGKKIAECDLNELTDFSHWLQKQDNLNELAKETLAAIENYKNDTVINS